MSRATSEMRGFATRLIAYEAKESGSSAMTIPAAFPVSDKLRPHLITIMGTAGYRALLSRALALANVEVRWLRGVHVRSDGSFEGLEELHSRITPADFFEGRVELVAQMLGLLVAFIGESLTLGLVREAWPAIPLNDLALGNGEKNENTK